MNATPSEPSGTRFGHREAARPERGARPEDLQQSYLQRLRRLLRLRRDHEAQLNEVGVRLLDRSIFAAYCDCLDVGAGFAAQHLLREEHLRSLGLPPERLFWAGSEPDP